MPRHRYLVLFVAALLLAAGTTFARPEPPLGPAWNVEISHGPFSKADTSGDGTISAEEWSALFDTLDADDDGLLEAAELPAPRGMVAGGLPAAALAHFIGRGADTDGDGSVTAREWEARVAALDADGDGTLAASELPLRRTAGIEELPPFVSEWDADGDGGLGAAELAALFDAADTNDDDTLGEEELGPRGRR